MLVLSAKEMKELISPDEVIEQIAESYRLYESNSFIQPDRIHVNREDDVFLYMPCFTDNSLGTKIITVFPNNRAYNEPAIQGIMLINDKNTGKPVAIMDGATLTAIRTGAVGGLGIDLTTKKGIKRVGLIGAGVQGFNQLLFACSVREIEDIYIYDIFKDNLPEFCQKLGEKLENINIHICDTTEELLKNSEAVITTTTATKPVLPNDIELLKGKHFVGIGSYKPNMREYPQEIFDLVDKVFIDTEFGKHETGDLITPIQEGWIKEDDIFTFSKLVTEKVFVDKERTTFFKSVGMALFDIVVGQYIYEKALEKGYGKNIEL